MVAGNDRKEPPPFPGPDGLVTRSRRPSLRFDDSRRSPFESPWTTPAQKKILAGSRRRLLIAAGIAAIGVWLLVLLGPSREEVRERFEFPGAEGPLKIMPEISIEPGKDPHFQLPKYFQETPPPPVVEVQPEPEDAVAEPAPAQVAEKPVESEEVIDPTQDPDLESVDLVQMTLPQQTNPWFVLIRMVRPQYPVNATEEQRRTPIITVEVGIYINERGEVTAALILSSDGGPVFDQVVLKAMNQWLYKPIIRDGKAPEGRWQRITWRFRSPYRLSP